MNRKNKKIRKNNFRKNNRDNNRNNYNNRNRENNLNINNKNWAEIKNSTLINGTGKLLLICKELLLMWKG